MGVKTQGQRVMPNADVYLISAEIDQPARYGRPTAERVRDTRAGWWQVTTPDGYVGSLNPQIHNVVEHEDGTITVTPSSASCSTAPGAASDEFAGASRIWTGRPLTPPRAFT
jgi:hypothetical protein